MSGVSGETLIAITPNDLNRIATGLRQELADGFAALKSHMVERPLTTKEAADYLRIKNSAMYYRIKSGAIPKKFVHKNGGTPYFFASELNELIRKS